MESRSHTLIIHTVSDTYEVSGTMREMEEKLNPFHFFRGNKGYLIHLGYVEGIKDNIAIVHKDELIISRNRKKDFMQALTQFWS